MATEATGRSGQWPASIRRRGWLVLVGLVGLAPTLITLHRAWAYDEDPEPGEPRARRAAQQAILSSILHDPRVLVNIKRADLPASPDILNLGKRSTGALCRCVSDNVDDEVRSVCAALLGRLGDRAALPALQGAVEAWNPELRGAAIAALRRIPDQSSFAALAGVLAREDETEDNRRLALLALGMLSDQRAVRLLRKTLRDEPGAELRAAAFRGLWSSRHLLARATLVADVGYALSTRERAVVLPAIHAAAELRDPRLVPALVPLMKSPDRKIRNRAVYALGRIGDRAATSALLGELPRVREARMLNNIAFALERLDPPAFFSAIRSLIEHRQAAIRLNAAFVLGDVRRPEGLPLLRKALEDENDLVRISALGAVGKLDAPEAIPLVERLAESPNRALARTALLALLALSNGEKRDLVYQRLVLAPEDDALTEQARFEAVVALARYGDPRVTEPVLRCVESGRCEVGRFASFLASQGNAVGGRLLLAWAKGQSALTDLLATLRPPGTGLLARSEIEAALGMHLLERVTEAIDLAGDVAEPGARARLVDLLRHPNAAVRLHAAVALARLGQTEVTRVVFSELDNLAAETLPRAARLLGRVREPEVRERWKAELGRRAAGSDVPLALAAARVVMEWEPEYGFFRFLDALAARRAEERDLAAWYLETDHRSVVTSLLRRALAREGRPLVRALLRKILDARADLVTAS